MQPLRNTLFAFLAAAATCLGAPAPLAQAAGRSSFVWADADGTVHTSVRLIDVAEPFLSIYRAEVQQGAQGPLAGGAQATGLEAARATWRLRLANARKRLLEATVAWAQLQAQDGALQGNPILRLTPSVQAAHQAGDDKRAQALARYLEARKALLITLPNEAQRAQVPMGWLQ